LAFTFHPSVDLADLPAINVIVEPDHHPEHGDSKAEQGNAFDHGVLRFQFA
tara:strand:+ start:671 stop:823 length:153 start_codon:yes stop_codon:yes gene_type:complete